MINSINSNIHFTGNKLKKTMATVSFLPLCLTAKSAPVKTDTFEKINNPIEVDSTIVSEQNKKEKTFDLDILAKDLGQTGLSYEELLEAPSPEIVVADSVCNAGIVVDIDKNRLYRYSPNGELIDGYHVSTGRIGRNGESITGKGIRLVDHVESYPYSKAYGTKRKKNPGAYGPNIIYLTIVDEKSGEVLGSNGEFIHGTNDPESIGKHASHGCVRMDNEVIKKLSKEIQTGTYVLIK